MSPQFSVATSLNYFVFLIRHYHLTKMKGARLRCLDFTKAFSIEKCDVCEPDWRGWYIRYTQNAEGISQRDSS